MKYRREFESMNKLWASACLDLHQHGRMGSSRAGNAVEVVGWSATLTNVDNNTLVTPERDMDPAYACAELLWYLSGQRAVKMLCAYAPSYKRFANPQTEDGDAFGAYGYRWSHNPGCYCADGTHGGDQLECVVQLLREKPDTRQAVITMWDSGDLPHAIAGDMNDIPCTVCMQFLIRTNQMSNQDELLCCVYMRSNDVWLGMPYDVFCFTSIQRLVAHRLGIKAGAYTHNVGSLHAYEHNLEKNFSLEEAAYAIYDPTYKHGYDERAQQSNSGWDVDRALRNEVGVRQSVTLNHGTVVDLGPGKQGPIGDAAIICIRKLAPQLVQGVPVSPALEAAWARKYGKQNGGA